jgi:malate dehydrogenase (oxaloacetate-decarboxylating)(NADP+)
VTSSSTRAVDGPSFGGINLEDIKAPDCFIIEQRLREIMDIPVFHDDQHGTAIIAVARPDQRAASDRPKIEDHQAGLQRRGRGGIACIELVKAMGAPQNITLCDTKGVIYRAAPRA